MKILNIYGILILLIDELKIGDEAVIAFLYLGILSGMIIFMLWYFIDNVKMRYGKLSEIKRVSYIKSKLPLRILTSCLVVIIISLVLPEILWFTVPKEVSTINRVIDKVDLTPIPNVQGDCYVGEEKDKKEDIYVYKLLGTQYEILKKNKVSDVQIVTISNYDIPRYEKIAEYRRIRIICSKAIYSWVNNIFCSNSGWQETLTKEKIKLYIPEGSLIKEYQSDTTKNVVSKE